MSNRPNMLINLPPPPSDPTTPNEPGPGTPNSTTTSLSALSVVAIKDGAVGHGTHRPSQSANTLEAERADRISRLAGLERVATVRSTPSGHLVPGAGPAAAPQYIKEISTVGSASATGSVGGKTTWASQSVNQSVDYDDGDKMSEDQEADVGDGVSSTGGFSDEDKASLVGFGEGAGSTVSGPVSTANARAQAQFAARQQGIGMSSFAPATPRTRPIETGSGSGGSTPMSGIEQGSARPVSGGTDAKMMDGISFDQGVVDTTVQSPQPVEQPYSGGRFSGVGTDMAETMMRDRLDDRDPRTMTTPPNNQSLGRFGFERE